MGKPILLSGDYEQWSARAEPEVVRTLRAAVGEFAERHGFELQALGDIRACVSEAVTNAVVHAYQGRSGPGTVTVFAEMQGDRLAVRVHDDGGGFDPRSDSPGAGLGLPMIRALTLSAAIAATPDGGTEISMTFGREAVVSPPLTRNSARVGRPARAARCRP